MSALGNVLVTTEVVVGVLALAAVLFLLVTFVRRRAIMRSGQVCVCGVRLGPDRRWRTGLLRLSVGSLDWFPLFGVLARPQFRWSRGSLELGFGARMAADEGTHPSLRDALLVPFRAEERRGEVVAAELAIGPEPYTALRAWIEAAPPGARPMTG